MRSGGMDAVVAFHRPGAPVRVGGSRVPGPPVVVAKDVPAEIVAGIGAERFANAENAATAPVVVHVRREPDVETLDPLCTMTDEGGQVYAILSVRPAERDPRRELEIAAVRSAPNAG